MTSRTRTYLGISLFLPLAAILLTTLACLPAPVGDPENSKVEAKLVGAWESETKEGQTHIVLVRPWDSHTYYVQYIIKNKNEEGEKYAMLCLKAWLTTLGEGTFLTGEPLNRLDYAFGADDGGKPFWIVGKVDAKDDSLKFRQVKQDSWIVKDLATREKLEAAIKAQVNNNELYADALNFKKITKDKRSVVDDALKALKINEN